jgi:hypothetical protein
MPLICITHGFVFIDDLVFMLTIISRDLKGIDDNFGWS